MTDTHRVIVTGLNADGKSLIAEDIPRKDDRPGQYDFWQTKAGSSSHDLSVGRSPMNFFRLRAAQCFVFSPFTRRSKYEPGRNSDTARLVFQGSRRSQRSRRYHSSSSDAYDADS